jgi:hypothetical protein
MSTKGEKNGRSGNAIISQRTKEKVNKKLIKKARRSTKLTRNWLNASTAKEIIT